MSGRSTLLQRLGTRLEGTLADMGLFSRHTSVPDDRRDRDYVLTGCALIAQDSRVVIVDVTVRLTVRQPTDERPLVKGYDPADEPAMHAVCVTVLRLMADALPSEDLLTERARMVDAVARGFSFAPVGTDLDARVLSVEVRTYDPTLVTMDHEFRLVTS